MNLTDLNKILGEHKIWVESYRKSGSRADLRGADLSGADLCGADLRGADLRGADLRG
ncbi:TPA: pentapeptide repeat-containing protein, partial [Yersinia enterocolitica]|nr:pentapeptide repeat-containing protein [Yersinia enterocolitica]